MYSGQGIIHSSTNRTRVLRQFVFTEEESNLAAGGFWAIPPMHQIEIDGLAEVGADGSRPGPSADP